MPFIGCNNHPRLYNRHRKALYICAGLSIGNKAETLGLDGAKTVKRGLSSAMRITLGLPYNGHKKPLGHVSSIGWSKRSINP